MLDMRTIIFIYGITDIVCLVVIVLLWRQSRKRFAGTIFWVVDFAFQTLALLLVVLRGQIPHWMSFVLANTLVMAGALLGYMGLLRFVGEKSSQIFNYVLLVAFAAVHTYFTFVQPDQAVRNLNVSMVLLIICLQCAWLLLRGVKPDMRQLTRGVGIVFAVYCVVSVIRIVEFFTGSHSASDYLKSGAFEQIVLISNQMLFILLTYSLVLMFNKRLLVDVKMGEEKFFKAFYSSPYAIMITRLSDGQISEVNEGFFKITGYQLADVKGNTTIGMHLWDRKEDRALVVRELASKGKVQLREFKFRKKSGEIITGLFSAEIIMVNNETSVLSSINDITERKLAQVALEENESAKSGLIKKLNDAQQGAMVGSWEWNLQTNYIWWSDETYRIFGVTQHDFVPSFETNGKFIHPDDFVKYGESFEHSFQTGKQLDVDLRIIAKDGQLKYCHAKGEIIFDDSGKKIRFIGTIMDITERKLAEEALKESERQYRNLFENSMEGVFQSTPEGKLISANIAFVRMFGYESSDEMIGAVMNIGRQLYLNPEERKKAVNILREVGYLKGFECQMCRKDGTTFWAVINVRFNENHKDIGYLEGFIIDINDRKRVETDILRLNEELENKVARRTNDLRQSQLALLNMVEDLNVSSQKLDILNRTLETTNKELESFSYSVSHDLRAPLRSIDGFSQALLEDYSKKLDNTGRNYLDRIRRATQNMGNLIEDMLKLSHVTRSTLRRESFDLSNMFQEIAEISQKNDAARIVDVIIQKGIIIEGDQDLMHIVLTNLMENAWKFTGKTKNACIEFGTLLADGKTVMFIRDNGVGFDIAYVDKLFGTFQRLHTRDEFAGTGIGLATVKRIITRHGGEVWAEGEVGKGATFYFTLPE
jgi:PAS domain S-box-containing protein